MKRTIHVISWRAVLLLRLQMGWDHVEVEVFVHCLLPVSDHTSAASAQQPFTVDAALTSCTTTEQVNVRPSSRQPSLFTSLLGDL